MAEQNMLTGGGIRTDFYAIPTVQPSAASQNPLVGYIQAQDAARGGIALEQQKFDLGKARLHAVHDEMGALATIPGGPTYDNVMQRINGLVQSGMLAPGDVQRILPNIPGGSGPEGNAARKSFFDQQLQLTGSYKDRMSAAYGQPGTANLGDVAQPTMTDPRTGTTTPVGRGMAIGMSPEAKATPRPFTDPNTGQTGTAPTSSFIDRQGYGRPSVSAPTNSVPGAGAATSMRPAGMPSPQAGGGVPAGAVPTSLPTGQTRMIDASSDRLTADLDAARNLQNDLLPIQSARSAIMALGPNGIGPGTQDRQKIASALQSAGLSWLPGVDSSRIENMDEAAKYLTQAQQSRAAAIKAGTDQQNQTAAKGSPNLQMSSTAALNVLNVMEGQRRMQQAATFSVPHDQNYLSAAAKWASTQDPRAYYFDRMTDDQKAKVIQSLGSKDSVAHKRFAASLRAAHNTGLLEESSDGK